MDIDADKIRTTRRFVAIESALTALEARVAHLERQSTPVYTLAKPIVPPPTDDTETGTPST